MPSPFTPVTNFRQTGGVTAAKANALPFLVTDNGDGTSTLNTQPGPGTPGSTASTPAYTALAGVYSVAAAGTSGTVVVPTGQKIFSYAASSATGGATVKVGSGPAIPLSANETFYDTPMGTLVGPVTFVFTATDSYCIAYLT